MDWIVLFDDAFAVEFQHLDATVREAVLTYANVLKQIGPQLGRPSQTRSTVRATAT